MEEWRDIKGYEGYYQVSNMGRIKSLERICKSKGSGTRVVKECIRKHSLTNCGYCIFLLHINKKAKALLVHRLVAEAFIPNPGGIRFGT